MKYPYHIDIFNPKSEEEKFYNYCKYILSIIPKKQWLIKIDADHIYLPHKLYKSFYLIKHQWDMLVLNLLNVYYDGKEILIDKNIKNAVDEWDFVMLKNIHFGFEEIKAAWDMASKNAGFFEETRYRNKRAILHELTQLHFPFQKSYRQFLAKESQNIPLSSWSSEDIGIRIDREILDSRDLYISLPINATIGIMSGVLFWIISIWGKRYNLAIKNIKILFDKIYVKL